MEYIYQVLVFFDQGEDTERARYEVYPNRAPEDQVRKADHDYGKMRLTQDNECAEFELYHNSKGDPIVCVASEVVGIPMLKFEGYLECI